MPIIFVRYGRITNGLKNHAKNAEKFFDHKSLLQKVVHITVVLSTARNSVDILRAISLPAEENSADSDNIKAPPIKEEPVEEGYLDVLLRMRVDFRIGSVARCRLRVSLDRSVSIRNMMESIVLWRDVMRSTVYRGEHGLSLFKRVHTIVFV